MNNHAGVLGPPRNPMLARIKSQNLTDLPPEILHDVSIALLTPGFGRNWWARALGKSSPTIAAFRESISPELQRLAVENWNSITRDDCIALARFGPQFPTPILIQILADRDAGMTSSQIQKTYGCSHKVIRKALESPPLSDRLLPAWFRGLIPGA